MRPHDLSGLTIPELTDLILEARRRLRYGFRKRLSPEEVARRKQLTLERIRSLNRGVYGNIGTRAQLDSANGGFETPVAETGTNRIKDNLGEGSTWKLPYRPPA